MLKFNDHHDHNLLFGPTNEEALTDIVRNSFTISQRLTKVLHEEIRPRFGFMRGSEFFMKDAYSLDIEEGAIKTSNQMFAAYII